MEAADNSTPFRLKEKQYQLHKEQKMVYKRGKLRGGKLVNKPTDFSDVVDIHTSTNVHPTDCSVVSVDGFNAPVWTFIDHPGLVYVPGYLSTEHQLALAEAAFLLYPEPPATTNHTAQYPHLHNLWQASQSGLKLKGGQTLVKQDTGQGSAVPYPAADVPDQPPSSCQCREAKGTSGGGSSRGDGGGETIEGTGSGGRGFGAVEVMKGTSGRAGSRGGDGMETVEGGSGAAAGSTGEDGVSLPALVVGEAGDGASRPGQHHMLASALDLRRNNSNSSSSSRCDNGTSMLQAGEAPASSGNSSRREQVGQDAEKRGEQGGGIGRELGQAQERETEDAEGKNQRGERGASWSPAGMDASAETVEEGDIWSSDGKGPAAEKLLRRLRWATLGPPYNWTTRQYMLHAPHRPLPPTLRNIACQMSHVLTQLGLPVVSPSVSQVPEVPEVPKYHSDALPTLPPTPSASAQTSPPTHTTQISPPTHSVPEYHPETPQASPLPCSAPGYHPDAAIVNYYWEGDTLGGHRDDAERDLGQPLISVSLGCRAVFLMGGGSKTVPPLPLMLYSGDVVVMAGPARNCYHGVPRILTDEDLPEGLQPQHVPAQYQRIMEYLSQGRINISIRTVK